MPNRGKRSARRRRTTKDHGFGEAGVNRFPKTTEIIKVLNRKRSAPRAEDTDTRTYVDYRLLTLVSSIVDADGELMHPSKNKSMLLKICPLREAFRKLPSSLTWHIFKARPSGRQAEMMRAMLSTARDGQIPADALRVARKCTRLSGQAVIDFAGDSAIPEDKMGDPYVGPFVWVIVQKSTAVAEIAAAHAAYKATHSMYLPSFDSLKDDKIEWREKARKQFNRIVREYSSEWKESAQGKADSSELLLMVRALVRNELPSFTTDIGVYGSRLYGVCSEESDIDIAIDVQQCPEKIEDPRRYVLATLTRVLYNSPVFSKVIFLSHARIPIIQFNYTASSGHTVAGEICAHGKIGRIKSQLIAAYVEADPRVRQVLALLKTWSIGRRINAPLTVNWYGLVMMALAYLIKERVVPPLQLLGGSFIDRTGWHELKVLQQSPQAIAALYNADNSFAPTTCLQSGVALPALPVDNCRTYFMGNHVELGKWRSPNQLSPTRLLHDMFKFYGYTFDPLAHVVSVRLGSPQIPRSSLYCLQAPDPGAVISKPNEWTKSLRILAIEDPFELTINCARNAPAHWVDGLLWEMRRAAWSISRKSPLNGAFTAIDRLALPPSEDIYCDAGVWAPAVASVGILFNECQRDSPGEKVYTKGTLNDHAAIEKLKRDEDTDLELSGRLKLPPTG
ncbi:hypothetical protein IW140_004215 [Coemansia sp. RSA 1813]|nr:hypothetical protein EV178_004316 [Coemansia sp. RSA 1646]KAJ1769482.1 hypothetical protein LPJ74_004030 [Coemansia sp. RSA 1843]KAJ2088067.1 hypothetical protein IW138_004487 [Coemansia sp. RSA 986]KAJ2214854.1 hypothetical protein EV179_002664 [Coemansia sp. RSA 487]KAJ2568044.1 hypothetical protein IW140_004215 [Coemansia sp. RSA 1813]